MKATGLFYPTYSQFSLSALSVLPFKCKHTIFLVFWDRQNRSVWLAKMLILCSHENVGGIRSFLQIWLPSPEPKLSFKKLMKCLALLVAKITMHQFVFFWRLSCFVKAREAVTKPQSYELPLFILKAVKRRVRDAGAPQTWRQRRALLRSVCLRCWSAWFCSLGAPLLVPHWHHFLQLHPSAHPCRALSWVLADTTSLSHMGLWIQTKIWQCSINMRGNDPGGKMTERGNFGRSNWKYPEMEKQGQC